MLCFLLRIKNYWYVQRTDRLLFLRDTYNVRVQKGFREVVISEVGFEVFVFHLSTSYIGMKSVWHILTTVQELSW